MTDAEPLVFPCPCGRDVPVRSMSRKDVAAALEQHVADEHDDDEPALLFTFSGGGRWRRLQTWKARVIVWNDQRRWGRG